MKVLVSVHGRFHGFDLARELHGRGLLSALVTTYPAFAARRFLSPSVPLITAPWLEAGRRLHARLRLPGQSDLWVARRFARFAARHLPEADVFVGWSGACLETLSAARRRGMKTIVERGSTHIAHQTEVLREAHARWGLAWHGTDPRLIAREEAEYDAADLICTSSSFARGTFIARGVDGAKVFANPYGVDLSSFTPGRPAPAGSARRRRLLFVGRVGVRKGVPWLLQAFRSLPPDWELHLVGPVDPEMPSLLARLPHERVVLRGPVPGSALSAEYRAADLFCLPSIEEGLALVLLQAMASGLPVVATEESGVLDAGRDGKEVVAVRAADAEDLACRLAGLAEDPEARARMGAAALARVRAGFDWSDYGDRAVQLYCQLVGNASTDGNAPFEAVTSRCRRSESRSP